MNTRNKESKKKSKQTLEQINKQKSEKRLNNSCARISNTMDTLEASNLCRLVFL